MSTRSDHFTAEQHRAWYERRLADPDTLFLIATVDRAPVGYVRFGRTTAMELAAVASPRPPDPSAVEVSVAIAPEHRARGYGIPALLAAEEELGRRWPDVRRIVALVLERNEVSHHVFERAGFVANGAEERFGKAHVRYVKAMGPGRTV